MSETPKNVIEALAAVMAEMPAIGKDQKSGGGGGPTYNYRGVEQITAVTQRLFARYKIVFAPSTERLGMREMTINGKPWTQEEFAVTYTVYGPGGIDDKITVGPIIGLGRDNSDKGANKAITQAYKYALLQVLCISDAKDDGDQDSHANEQPYSRPKAPEAQPRTVDLSSLVTQLNTQERKWLRESWQSDYQFSTSAVPVAKEQECRTLIESYAGTYTSEAMQLQPGEEPFPNE